MLILTHLFDFCTTSECSNGEKNIASLMRIHPGRSRPTPARTCDAQHSYCYLLQTHMDAKGDIKKNK